MRDRFCPSPRTGVSDVLATGLILALLVVAFIVTSGLWFGTLGPPVAPGPQASAADLQIDESVVPARVGQGAPYVYCSGEQGSSLSAYVHLYNAGTSKAAAKLLELDYSGTTVPVTLGGSCVVPPGGGLYIVILTLPVQPSVGEKYSGQVSFQGGGAASFDGTFG